MSCMHLDFLHMHRPARLAYAGRHACIIISMSMFVSIARVSIRSSSHWKLLGKWAVNLKTQRSVAAEGETAHTQM